MYLVEDGLVRPVSGNLARGQASLSPTGSRIKDLCVSDDKNKVKGMKIFIAGPRAVTNLDRPFEKRLNGIVNKNYAILVGDAPGVDKAVQSYFFSLNYPNVTVYASNGKARTNVGKWPIKSVPVSDKTKGFDYYAAKDKAMADSADYGFMLWNGESRGTLTNIINLLTRDKEVLIYFTPKNSFVTVSSFERLDSVLSFCSDSTKKLYHRICSEHTNKHSQLSLYDKTL